MGADRRGGPQIGLVVSLTLVLIVVVGSVIATAFLPMPEATGTAALVTAFG